MCRTVANLGRRVSVAAWLLTGLFAVSCSGGTLAQNQQASQVRVKVVSTSSIIGDWARQVGGEGVRVEDMIPPGVDPHSYQPGARDIVSVADADLVLSVGLNLEGQWLIETINNVESEEARHLVLGPLVGPMPVSDGQNGTPLAADEMDPHFWM